MRRVPRDQFFQFSWRPRAPTLLSKEQEAEIAKHLKDYSKRYDEIDSKLLQEVLRPPLPVVPAVLHTCDSCSHCSGTSHPLAHPHKLQLLFSQTLPIKMA